MAGNSDERTTVAALDLGSNSFHMLIGRVHTHDVHILDRLREPVRLAGGLDADNALTDEAQQRALDCLERFGQRLRELPSDRVRAVGTNTLRRARNAAEFRVRAREALGHPIEVLPGQEEARLIYLGVAHTLPSDSPSRLVVDIGGGSTEVIAGEGFEVLRAHSMYMGCVTYSRTYFPDGLIRKEFFDTAETSAAVELRTVKRELQKLQRESSIGASGTIHAISELLALNGFGGPEITPAGLKKLRKALVKFGRTDRIELQGLKPDRAPVLPGGLAILTALFRSLDIQSMTPSPGALREGVLYDLLGRIKHEDIRDRSIRKLVEQYHVDLEQAARVEKTARELAEQTEQQCADNWEHARKALSWAAWLHEIGLAISYTGHHRHGAYLLAHSDLPGFSEDDRGLLAVLVGSHRRKLRRQSFSELAAGRTTLALRLSILLRLAVLLNRSRSSDETPKLEVSGDCQTLDLEFPKGWLAEHPLSVADLKQEIVYLKDFGVKLVVREAG